MTHKNTLHLQSILQKSAILFFAIVPIALSFFAQGGYIVRIWKSVVFWGVEFLAVLVVFPLFLSFYQDGFLRFLENKHLVLMLWLVTLGVVLRFVFLPVISTNFDSDMEDIHRFAIDVAAGHPLANLQNYPNIPRSIFLNMSGLLLAGVYRIFPASFTTAKICMIVFGGLTIWLLYLNGLKVSNSRVGFIAALMFAMFPSIVLYTGVLSGEHVAVFLITAVLLLYIKLHENPEHKAYYLLGYLFGGCMVGLIDWFRPVGIILLISIFIADLLYAKKRDLLVAVVALAGLLTGYLFINNLAVRISEKTFGVDVLPVSQRLGHYILVGLNPETEGTINGEDYEIANTTYERFGDDHWSAQVYLVRLAFERLKGHSVLKLFGAKFYRMWANQDALFAYSLIGSNDQEMVTLMEYIGVFLYLMIMIFVGFQAIRSIFQRPAPAVFVMQLFILGFTLLLLFVEAQNRYVIVVFPYLMVLGALGLEDALKQRTKPD